MYSITVTITDKTAAAQSLYALLTEGSKTGYTVAPAEGYPESANVDLARVWVQADPGNAAAKILLGDANTANDGSRQARVLEAGDIFPLAGEQIYLKNWYARCDTNSTIFNLGVER